MIIIEDTIDIISIASLVLLSISLGMLIVPIIESLESKIKYNTNNYTKECNNLSLEDTAQCLNSYVKSIFIYNVTDDSIDLTLEELKERGGDCKDWAELYQVMADNLGFHTEMPVVSTRRGYAHTFTIISDDGGYCLLDQVNFKCWKIEW